MLVLLPAVEAKALTANASAAAGRHPTRLGIAAGAGLNRRVDLVVHDGVLLVARRRERERRPKLHLK